MNWLVYLIECGDGSLYCGITNRPHERWMAHQNKKGARYTQMRGVKEMRLIVCCLNKNEALRLEKQVKKMISSRKRQLFKQAKVIE